jgi:hypothetical protein
LALITLALKTWVEWRLHGAQPLPSSNLEKTS